MTIEIKTLFFKLEKSITTNVLTFNTSNGIALFLSEKENIIGESFIHMLAEMPHIEITNHIEKIYSLAKSHQAFDGLENWKKFWFYQNPICGSKSETYALAALDIAAWDMFSKLENKPLHLMLNNTKPNPVRVYGTTGWLSLTEEELISECEKYASIDINGFKIRLGREDDYQRVRAVRKSMGDDYVLMLDATQQYDVKEAIKISQKMADLNIAWFEEPVGNSIADLMTVKQHSPIPIAAGENVFTVEDFEEICKRKAVDILQPDIIRCGGITGFIEIAKIIQKYDIPLCNHLLPELSLSVISAFPNCYFLEYDDLLPLDIFNEKLKIKNNCMIAPETPGTGITISRSAIAKFEI